MDFSGTKFNLYQKIIPKEPASISHDFIDVELFSMVLRSNQNRFSGSLMFRLPKIFLNEIRSLYLVSTNQIDFDWGFDNSVLNHVAKDIS